MVGRNNIVIYLIFLLFSERCTGGIALRLLVSPSRRWYRPPVAGIALLHPLSGSITFISPDPCRAPRGRINVGDKCDKCDTTLKGV